MTSLDKSAFIGKFVEEARDRLKTLTGAVLRLEQQAPSDEAFVDVLRQAHSLKGSARMLGLLDIAQIAHRLEEVFVTARRTPGLLDAHAYDVIFSALDALTIRVEQLASGITDPAPIDLLCQTLETLARGTLSVPPPLEESPEPSSSTGPLAPLGASLRVPVAKLRGLTHLAAEMVLQSLEAAERHAEVRRLEAALRRLRDAVREARLQPGSGEAGAALAKYADALETLARQLRGFAEQMGEGRVRLALLTEELRQQVISLTMVPVATVFDGLARAVRDLAREFGKSVELVVRGRETELDKQIVDQIADPLGHLVRNAIDHGIERPEERLARGKPPAGRLVVAAEQQGNRIVITVRDDGRGIDPAELKAAARRLGIAEATELERWSERELLDLVFHPGFSTRRAATDVSGRGLGLDAVREVIARLGGGVRVQSEVGRGTSVVLDLPLSLALLRVVLVEAGGDLFALPTASVSRVVWAGPEAVGALQQSPVLRVGEEDVPLVTLSALVGLPALEPPERPVVVIVEAHEARLALGVEAIREEEELVFKELKGPVRHHRLFAGVSLRGSGEIVPILDVEALLDLAARTPRFAAVEPAPRPAPSRAGRILIVEDSLVAGELQKNILLTAGYQAEIAADGIEALDKLLGGEWDLVIADVDMPRMDGLELTARIRADPRLRELPVVIVTARDSLEARRRGVEVGADAYIVKREFDQEQLLATVGRLIGRATTPRPAGAAPV
jgi:two-component system chemotaxis sensor kinase CheA